MSPAPPHGSPLTYYFGRPLCRKEKGVGYLLDAMRVAQKGEGAAVDLALIGDGPLAEVLKRQAAGLTRTRFPGAGCPIAKRDAQRARDLCPEVWRRRPVTRRGLPNVRARGDGGRGAGNRLGYRRDR